MECKTRLATRLESDTKHLVVNNEVTLTQIFLSVWCRLNGFVRFLTMFGLVKGFTIVLCFTDLQQAFLLKGPCYDHLLLYAAAVVTTYTVPSFST